MSRDYPPGTVAVATVRGVKGLRIVRSDMIDYDWIAPSMIEWRDAGISCASRMFTVDEVTDVRPLIVLDPDDADEARHMAHTVALSIDDIPYAHTDYAAELAAAGKRALRTLLAEIHPPKIEEPTGLGAVVEDARGVRWVRLNMLTPRALQWHTAVDTGKYTDWWRIDVVRVLSEGVTP